MLLSLGAILFVCYKAFNTLDFKLNAVANLAYMNADFSEKHGLKKIELNTSNSDELHFNRLYRDYYAEGLGPENDAFLQYYSKNNAWRRASMVIDGEKYKVQVKSHGRTPYAHKFGALFSLAVKFKKNAPFFNSNRVNFVIYNRIQMRLALLEHFAQKFNVLTTHYELIDFKFGERRRALYFVEQRINEDFFKTNNLPYIVFNDNVDGSLIYNQDFSLEQLEHQLTLALEQHSYSTTLKKQIKDDYQAFNKAIQAQDHNTMLELLDANYCARLEALRVVYGCDGHGFNFVNLDVVYDTIKHVFYPIVNRDIVSNKIQDCQGLKNQARQTYISNFWQVLEQNEHFNYKTQQALYDFLEQNNSADIAHQINNINKQYLESHLLKKTSLNNRFDGSTLLDNINCLRTFKNEKYH